MSENTDNPRGNAQWVIAAACAVIAASMGVLAVNTIAPDLLDGWRDAWREHAEAQEARQQYLQSLRSLPDDVERRASQRQRARQGSDSASAPRDCDDVRRLRQAIDAIQGMDREMERLLDGAGNDRRPQHLRELEREAAWREERALRLLAQHEARCR